MEQGKWEEILPDSDLWNWDESPEIEGILIGASETRKRDGSSYMRYNIEREGDNVITILGSKILDSRLKKCDPGTRIKITFLGMQSTQDGMNEYRMFKVEKFKVDEGEAAPPMEKIELPDEKEFGDIPF